MNPLRANYKKEVGYWTYCCWRTAAAINLKELEQYGKIFQNVPKLNSPRSGASTSYTTNIHSKMDQVMLCGGTSFLPTPLPTVIVGGGQFPKIGTENCSNSFKSMFFFVQISSERPFVPSLCRNLTLVFSSCSFGKHSRSARKP